MKGSEPKRRQGFAGDKRAAIRERALALGFTAVGFAPAHLESETRAHLGEFIARGYHGDMGWIEDKAERRGDPRALWPEAQSVVMLGLSYAPEENPAPLPADRANISVYARGRDYHDVLKKKLRRLADWTHKTLGGGVKLFVDTAPVMEKPLARRAGLGWQGKHTNLLSREQGSWLFLGSVFTTLDLEPDAPAEDHCGACRRCLDACPTAAFPAPYVLDARRCISYLTIEHRGHIDAELRPLIGNRVYGCDDCLAACPWNKFAQAGREAALRPRADLTAPGLAELAALDDAAFRKKFSGSSIKRTGRDRFVRNVLIALGNSADPALLLAAEARLDDASALVRAMAVWALKRLAPPQRFMQLRTDRLARESDPDVRSEWTRA
ncbi:MAG: tRNA epoxyqueuosine(34) reductase QueG [Rhodospirillales bacterium]